MTRQDFITKVKIPCNGLTFDVGFGTSFVMQLSKGKYVIRINSENYGEFESVEELLEKFFVNGERFEDKYLPQIKELNILKS